ncbi:MAG: XRE family transcriptional regulator [Syntrophus sp. (in: bacteria)]|nr:XRE family transcriptional regulator [Syntrophus sp. (in: bacteria)]
MDDIKQLIGNRIRELRKQQGLSQEELGEKAELHHTYVGAVERGEKNCSIDTLQKIANGLEIEIPELFVDLVEINTAELKKRIVKEIEGFSPDAIQAFSCLVKLLVKK